MLKIVWLCASLWLAFSVEMRQATAQQEASRYTAFQLQQFRPDGEPLGFFQTHATSTLGQWKLAVGFWMHYALDPLFLVSSLTGQQEALMRHQLGGDLQIGLGLLSWLDIGITAPMSLYQVGRIPDIDALGEASGRLMTGFAMGDMRIRLKAQLLRQSWAGIDLSLMPFVGLPTGNDLRMNGEGGVSAGATLILGREHLLGSRILRWGIELGYRYQPETEFLGMVIGHEMLYSAAASIEIIPQRFEALLELHGVLGFSGGIGTDRSPMGLMAGARIFPLNEHRLGISLGIGTGLIGGYGSPRVRAFLGIVWAPWSVGETRDSDGDGVPDKEDRCPSQKGARENRGCPWPDRDGDGVPDKDDRCPDEAGSVENQGCPVAVARVTPPPPRRRQVEEPPPRRDTEDPPKPSTQEGTWGKPGDRDGDGIPDRRDKCPDVPGTRKRRGCPVRVLAWVHRGRSLRLRGRIRFTRRVSLSRRDRQTLWQIAAILRSRPSASLALTATTYSRSRKAWVKERSEQAANLLRNELERHKIAPERIQTQARTGRGRRTSTAISFSLKGL
jgi:hypothetical protein